MAVGQFWSIPLADTYYACGRVLQFDEQGGKRHSRIFLAGLLDWIDQSPPSSESIRGTRLFAHGAAHVKTITANRGQILGCRELDLDDIEIPYTLDGTDGPNVCQGFRIIRAATEQDLTLPIFSNWGFGVIVLLAEKLLRHRLDGEKQHQEDLL